MLFALERVSYSYESILTNKSASSYHQITALLQNQFARFFYLVASSCHQINAKYYRVKNPPSSIFICFLLSLDKDITTKHPSKIPLTFKIPVASSFHWMNILLPSLLISNYLLIYNIASSYHRISALPYKKFFFLICMPMVFAVSSLTVASSYHRNFYYNSNLLFTELFICSRKDE